MGLLAHCRCSQDGGANVKEQGSEFSCVFKHLKVASNKIQAILPYFQDTIPVFQCNIPISVTHYKKSIHKQSIKAGDDEYTYISDKQCHLWVEMISTSMSRSSTSGSISIKIDSTVADREVGEQDGEPNGTGVQNISTSWKRYTRGENMSSFVIEWPTSP
jgi:hypothetical protein